MLQQVNKLQREQGNNIAKGSDLLLKLIHSSFLDYLCYPFWLLGNLFVTFLALSLINQYLEIYHFDTNKKFASQHLTSCNGI